MTFDHFTGPRNGYGGGRQRSPGEAMPPRFLGGGYRSLIEEEASRVGIDPDLLRAVIYVENSQGWYGHVAETLGMAKSLLPANIRPNLWGSLVPESPDLRDPRSNIAAAAILLQRISERVPDGDIAKIATLYNSLAKEVVEDYGARVSEVYRSRPWQLPDPRSLVPSLPELNVP